MENLTPRHVLKDESDRLGVARGWYGIKASGTFMTGPSTSEKECWDAITKLTGVARIPL